jgi:hypothetical protein
MMHVADGVGGHGQYGDFGHVVSRDDDWLLLGVNFMIRGTMLKVSITN